nr:putative HAD-hydrolase [Candidatus Prometheoarchaeum syntrophicum]
MGVIFDLDGTIIDDVPFIINIHRKIAEDYNFPLTDELDALFREKVGIPLSITGSAIERYEVMMFLGKKMNLNFFRRIKMMFQARNVLYEFVQKCPLIDGTQETLEFLKINNVKIGMFTNASRNEIKSIFDGREDILNYFEGNIISKDDVKHKKPHPEGVMKLLHKWGFSPQNIMIFGDSPKDILAGKKAGIITVGVLSGAGTFELFQKVKADYIINDISEIPLKFPNLIDKKVL